MDDHVELAILDLLNPVILHLGQREVVRTAAHENVNLVHFKAKAFLGAVLPETIRNGGFPLDAGEEVHDPKSRHASLRRQLSGPPSNILANGPAFQNMGRGVGLPNSINKSSIGPAKL